MPLTLTRRRFLAGLGAGAGALSAAALTAACRATPLSRQADVREVARVVPAAPGRDGAGVNLRRSLGSRALPSVDPFLLLDEIHSDDPADYAAGFPTHPHRGFETVSILVAGAFEHRDSVGNHGLIGAGGAQWMTAGKGIVHSEMPRQTPGLDLWGLQLWVNLPAVHKLRRPRYQDLAASDVVAVDVDDARVRVIAGEASGRRGPVEGIVVAPALLDAVVPAGGRMRLPLEATHAACLYVLAGELAAGVAATRVGAGELAVLGPGARVELASCGGARLLVLAAAPIGEPVARSGPFVMNTQAELDQAWADYRSGRLVEG